MLKSQLTNLFIKIIFPYLSRKMVGINQIILFTIIMVLTTTTRADTAPSNMIRSLSAILYLLTKGYSTS